MVADIVAAHGDQASAGAIAIGLDSIGACPDVVGARPEKKLVAVATGRVNVLKMLPLFARMITANSKLA